MNDNGIIEVLSGDKSIKVGMDEETKKTLYNATILFGVVLFFAVVLALAAYAAMPKRT